MNKDYIIINGELYHAEELYHYGVPGMKWGRRKSTGVENAYSRKIAKKAKRLNEAELNETKEMFEKPSVKTFLRDYLIGYGGMFRRAYKESVTNNRKDQLNKAIKKAKKNGYDVDVKRNDNIKTGKSVVDVILKDKSGNTYNSNYEGNFNPYFEKKKKKK